MDDFSNAPRSISEIRAQRDRDLTKWTPRDVLVDLLRDIDTGAVDLDAIFIAFRNKKDDPHGHCGFSTAGPDPMTVIGVCHLSLDNYIRRGREG